MPIVFSGSYEVDSFTFGYFLPLDSPNGATTDAIVRFYTAGPSGGAFDGTLISATRFETLEGDPNGDTDIVFHDLAPLGNFFRWDSTLLPTEENGGWVSIEFSNPDAGWEIATGDSTDDYFQDMTDGEYYSFGGSPQAAFYIELSGQRLDVAVVPEQGTAALIAGVLLPVGILYLSRRNRRPTTSGAKHLLN
ncbi:MAG: hypothetical protein H8F28_15220 [Fibrella sp.]|nr:hypothetical protein [Armatimonadota bacterium]